MLTNSQIYGRMAMTAACQGGMYFVAILIWGFALGTSLTPWIIAGIVTGVVMGGLNALAVGGQSERRRSDDMMRESPLTPIAMLIGAVALAVWVVRAIF